MAGVVAVIDEPAPAAPIGTLAAPGRDVPTTLSGSRWATVSGASYAAAHVSGLLALMIELQQRSGRIPARRLRPGRAGGLAASMPAPVSAGPAARCVCACGVAPAMESVARH
jgi:subtilisin family serine protease